MFKLKYAIPMFLLFSSFCGVSEAQTYSYKTTYCIQVKYEMWRNGSSYWATEYETSNLADAQLVFAFFEAALEDGSLCEILNCGFDWIVVDVRLKTKYEWYVQPAPIWQNLLYRKL